MSACPVSETEARSTLDICGQILEALKVLHDAEIVHHDIKPKNVLVAEKVPVHVKLADFGISKHTEGTELKTQVGTFGYMAPEVLGLLEDDYNYTKAVDVWSLGCLVYKILTGEPPFTWMPHLPLEKYVKGHSLFPEQPLLERGISIDGRSFIARMLRPVPKMRSLASITLIEEWIMPQMIKVPSIKATSISSGQPSTSPGDRTQDDGTGSLQPRSSTNDTSTKLSTDLSIEGPMAKSEMDYLSLEVWSQVRREGWLEDGTARLERLLEAGANPNIIRRGYTALHLALLSSPSTSTKPAAWVATLLKYGANPNLKNQDGLYASHQMVGLLQHRDYSTQEKRISPNLLFICNKLLAYGAWLEARDNTGYTPLIYACTLRHGPMVEFLLQKGANVHASCFQGRTALFHFVWNGGDLDTVKLLLSKEADINTRDVQGVTLLEAAMRQSLNYSVIAHLVNNGAEYSVGDGGVQRRIQRARLWEKIRNR